jgi:hypothetical protein
MGLKKKTSRNSSLSSMRSLAEVVDTSTISLTPKVAAEKFKEILAEEGKEGWGLRFADKRRRMQRF